MASASKLAACESPFDTIVYLLFRYMKEYDDVVFSIDLFDKK